MRFRPSMGCLDRGEGVEYVGEELQCEVSSCRVTANNYILGKDAYCYEVIKAISCFPQLTGEDGVGKEI